MIWKTRRRTLDLTRHGAVMGILNVTPDSFFDGGRFAQVDDAVQQARAMIREGADIIDIGGESTRPGAESISADEELSRAIPVIRRLRAESTEVLISIDTSKASIASAAVEAGADIINDVTALRGDAAMPTLAASSGAAICLMHMRGTPRDMQKNPHYENVVTEVREFLEERVEAALSAGIARERLAIDPGIGFGKTAEHNLELLRDPAALTSKMPDRPILIGVSRKSFLAGSADDRLWPTVALTSLLRGRGVRIFRVHDVRPNREALRMTEAILGDS